MTTNDLPSASALPTVLSPTPRSTPSRTKERARSDRAELYAVLDAGLIGHLGIEIDGSVHVLPTGYGRDGDTLYLHGSTGARSLRAAARGVDVCFTVTQLDGIVYARSTFHHSMNYHCAVVHGTARLVEGEERMHGLEVLTEHLAPGSWHETRLPDAKESAATLVLALPLVEASVKVRTGPPADDDEDVEADLTWAGVLPVVTSFGTPEPCPLLPTDTPVPGRVADRAR